MFERTTQGAVEVIRGTDPLNAEFAPEVRDVLESVESQGQPHVVFDLTEIPLIDSSGLELLLDFQDHYTDRGGVLRLAAPNALCRDILKITDVGNQIELFDNVVSAVGSFAQ